MGYRKRFVVEPGTKVRLGKIDPAFKDKHESHDTAKAEIGGERRSTPDRPDPC